MPATPYRTPPEGPLPSCDQCGVTITDPGAKYDGRHGPICRACFFGQYDLLALFGIGALAAGAITGSAALLLCGFAVPCLGAYAIHRGGV